MEKIILRILVLFFLSYSCFYTLDAQGDINIKGIIDSIMQTNYPDDKPGASLIVMKDRQLLFRGAYGKADIENSVPVRVDTKFRIGSITKQFTSIGILKLYAEDKLSLDDPIHLYYPELFNSEIPITIRQLLSHTSGIKDLSQIRSIRPFMFSKTAPDTIITLISQEELSFTPGSAYDYSNSGYFILGGIIEKVSGRSYQEFLNEYIFNPLGMKNTHYANRGEISGDFALGYFTRPDHFVSAPNIHSSLLFSAGGIWSTVSDMAIWNEALYNDILMDQKFIRMAFTANILNDGRFTDYGFGFRTCQVNGLASIEHGGGVFGYSCYGIRIESAGVYVLILSNFERNNNYDELAAQFAALSAGKPYQIPDKNIMVDPKLAKTYLGKYVSENGDTLTISLQDRQVHLFKNESNYILIPIESHTFLIGDSLDDRITFHSKGNTFILKPRRALGIKAVKI